MKTMQKNTQNIIQAKEEKSLVAEVVSRTPLRYEDEVDGKLERPPHVRAASGMTPFYEHLAIIQDDASFLALVDPKSHTTKTVVIPDNRNHLSGGESVEDPETQDKLDLEACVGVPGTDNQVLVAFGSGSRAGREWVMMVDWREGGDEPQVHLFRAKGFFDAVRSAVKSSGAKLNLEGAIFKDENTLMLFQRGNIDIEDGQEPKDVTIEVRFSDFERYFEDPENVPVPEMKNVKLYELGTLNGTQLTFSDAENVNGTILFSASAEAPSGETAGSVIGVLREDGARYTELSDQDGTTFEGKIEGISVDPEDPNHIWFVVDEDDGDTPSEIFEVQLSGSWYE